MLYHLLALLTSFALFAQTTLPSSIGALSGVNAIFPIDASVRGLEIVNLFNNLKNKSVPSGAVYEIAIQTKFNGLLTWVQNVTGTTNNTLLVISWGTTPANSAQIAPAVIPAEQIVQVIFTVGSQQFVSSTSNPYVSAGNVSGTLPIYSIHPSQRAADVVSVFNYFNSTIKNGIFKYMTIQTTLSAVSSPLYQTATAFNGTLPYVQSITVASPASSILQVTYRQKNAQPNLTMEVPAEFVSTIIFTQT